jgi:hypothetical protein
MRAKEPSTSQQREIFLNEESLLVHTVKPEKTASTLEEALFV